MNLDYCVKESQLLDHTDSFGFVLQAGALEFQRHLSSSWSSNKTILEQRAKDILRLRNHPEILQSSKSLLLSLQEAEKTVLDHQPSDTSKTAEGQIFFQGELTKPLNHIPFLITLFVILKIWVAPVLALFTPLLLLVMPYVIMTTVMDMPVPWDTYLQLAKQMVLGIQPTETWKPKHYVQALWTSGSVIQSMASPFMTAYHTYNLDFTIVKRGDAILSLAKTAETILNLWKSKGILSSFVYKVPEVPQNPREAVAWFDAEPLATKILWRILGTLSLMTTMADDASWIPVHWSPKTNSTLELVNCYDIAIPEAKAVKSSIELKGHSLLTGPNRGGKSSALRSILQQVLLGQTFGVTYKAQGSWKPFALLFTRLKSQDHAGRESLFEMEVRMASKIYHIAKKTQQHTLVLIDELFHSTNPPDAETSAKLFLKLLWGLPTVKSIISTHIFSLCEEQGSTKPQLLCCPATENADGKIQYSYEIKEGICFVSSVKEVLTENGLTCA